MLSRRMLKIRPVDPAWALPSRFAQNRTVWTSHQYGFVVPSQFLKRATHEEALRKGDSVHPQKAAAVEG